MLKMLPNILTFGRFVLTVIFLILLFYAGTGGVENATYLFDWAFALFVIAGITDAVDGKIARMMNVTSKMGRIMDPLADKVLVCGAFIFFAIIGKPVLFDFSPILLSCIHWFTAAVLIAREVYVTILRQVAESRGIEFAATVSGKVKMFLQSFAIGTVLIKTAHLPQAQWGHWFTLVVYVLMLGATVISGIRATQRKSWQQASSA